jgi:hypothetical protein
MSKNSFIEQFMRGRYRLPSWALFFEVPDCIGFSNRRADAIAVSIDIHTRGRILGFEFKANRSDWLRELKQPKKAACFAEKCNEFYIVASQEVIYDIKEIPEGYGWLDPYINRRRKKATQSESNFDLEMMCILLRRAALMCEKYEAIRRIVDSPAYDTRDFDTKETND